MYSENSTSAKSTYYNDLLSTEIVELVDKNTYNPSITRNNEALLNNLGIVASTTTYQDISLDKNNDIADPIFSRYSFQEEFKVQAWKFVENISAKLISFDNETVLLDCLVDKEDRIYVEQEFKISLFKGHELKVGKLFKIGYYERNNQMMIDLKDDPNLVLESDFPNIDFFAEFGTMPLNKRID